jgi:uncharacterized protein
MFPKAWHIIVLVCTGLFVPPAAAEPSWCRYARSETEKTICATPQLWELDSCEDRLFKAALNRAPANQRRSLDLEERAWTRERDRCGSEISCIQRRYRERATAIDPIASAACGLRGAARAAPEPVAAEPSWCRYARSETEKTICATPQLWELDGCEDGLFKAALNKAPAGQRHDLDLKERAWTRERDLCGRDASCISRRYRERAAAIDPVGSAACSMRVVEKTAPLPAAAPLLPSATGCSARAELEGLTNSVVITSPSAGTIPHGGAIEVDWRFSPLPAPSPRLFLVGTMPETVRFDGNYRYDENGSLKNGPGFIALPGASRAPYGFTHGAGRTRIVIPIFDMDVSRAGRLWIKPYEAGALRIEWALVAADVGCPEQTVRLPAAAQTFQVGAGPPRIVVQDFIARELSAVTPSRAAPAPREIELSSDGRHRLDIFDRRYRVFDRRNGALVADRSGVKPRFSPTGRFVLASIGDPSRSDPQGFEIFDLAAGRVTDAGYGPLMAWSNGDAMLLDATRAYQGVRLINTLIDPQKSEHGAKNRPGFFSGCGSCDASAYSNIQLDWDRLVALRGDAESAEITSVIALPFGRDLIPSGIGTSSTDTLRVLQHLYGQSSLTLKPGWHDAAPLSFTHIGRGIDGYAGSETSFQLLQANRPSQAKFLAPRRLALAHGRLMLPNELRQPGTARAHEKSAWRRSAPVAAASPDAEYVAAELAKLGIRLTTARIVPEVPLAGNASLGPVREWTAALKADVITANPSLAKWWDEKVNMNPIVAGAWRLRAGNASYLLVQHGEGAMTLNGAHGLSFDLLATLGPDKGRLQTFQALDGSYSQTAGREHTLGRPFLLDGDRLIIAVPGTGKAVALHIGQGVSPPLLDLAEPNSLCGYFGVDGSHLVVQANCDGQFFVFDPTRGGSPILSGRVVDEEFILYTPEGYYTATYEGGHYVHVAFPGVVGVHSFEQFAAALERRDVVQAIVKGARTRLPSPALQPPPAIEMTAEAETGDTVSLRISARSDVGLRALAVYEDGRPALRVPASGRHFEESLRVPRKPHVRTLSAVAIDAKDFKSRAASIDLATRPRPANTLHVVAVGIDAYDQADPLALAKADAESIVKALTKEKSGYYGRVSLTKRLDREASPATVLSDLRAAVEQATEDDTILLFFAGHGARTADGRYFMMTSSSDPARLSETAIQWTAVSAILSRARGRVIVIVDACHAGQTGAVQATNDQAVSSLTAASNAALIVLAASKGRQESEEMAATGGGVFTQSLARILGPERVKADTNGDGLLDVSEIYRAVRQAVVTATQGRQTPWLVRRHVVGDFPLF